MTASPRMADSVAPYLIPRTFRQPPNGVAFYRDGPYAVEPKIYGTEFPRHIGISVTGDPAMAQIARCVDVERGDATPAHVAAYASARWEAGHDDALAYCDRSTVAEVLEAAPADEYGFWIATLDGIYRTPQVLCFELKQTYGVDLDPARVWAIQWLPMGEYDESRVFGNPRWARAA